MIKANFNQFINIPSKSQNLFTKETINSLIKKFPYCQSLYKIKTLLLNSSNDIDLSESIIVTALFSNDRRELFQSINPTFKIKKPDTKIRKNLSFTDWLKEPNEAKFKLNTHNTSIKNLSQIQEFVDKSTKDNDDLITETLAKLYYDQGHYNRAIQAYKILCLRFPKKSAFFVSQIKKIKNLI